METLNILRQPEYNSVKVTYFLHSDHIPGNESVVQQILADGHAIGNHSPEQDKWYSALGDEEKMSSLIDEAEDEIRKALNNPNFATGMFRSPGGSLQWTPHGPRDDVPGHSNWYHYGWHVDSEDWARDAESAITFAMEQIDAGAGGDRPIILMHSIHSHDPQVLSGIIDELRKPERGFSNFSTLPRADDSPGVLYPLY